MTSSEPRPSDLPLPTFLVIGAQKAATRWLRHHLGTRDDVFCARWELSFFNDARRFAAGTDLYRRGFDGWRGEPVVGESTPGYLMWWHDPAQVAERIDATLPGVRLLAVLRDPVDRAQSARVHHVLAERLPPSTRLPDHVRAVDPEHDRLGIVAGGWYARSLRPYREQFGDRLLVVLHDDVRADPGAVLAAAASHVGAAPGAAGPDLDEVRNSSRQSRRAGLAAAAAAPLSEAERAEIEALFAHEVEALEVLLDRDLSRWRRAS